MRLTEKTQYGYKDIEECVTTTCSDKLGQLEDIEEELGIDLITLFKALKSGIWFINPIDNTLRNSVTMFASIKLDDKGLSLYSMEMDILFFLKDYGKTWALTKEELEK